MGNVIQLVEEKGTRIKGLEEIGEQLVLVQESYRILSVRNGLGEATICDVDTMRKTVKTLISEIDRITGGV